MQAAQPLVFKALSDAANAQNKPVTHLIYTHGHRDHAVFGPLFREKSNEWIFNKVNEKIAEAKKLPAPKQEIKKLSTLLLERKAILLGHIIRNNEENASVENDHMFNITFENDNYKVRKRTQRRVGRPRGKWAEEVMKYAWKSNYDTNYTGTIAQNHEIFNGKYKEIHLSIKQK